MEVKDTPALHRLSNAITLEIWFKAKSFPRSGVASFLRKNGQAGRENFFLRLRFVDGKANVEMMPCRQAGVLREPCEIQTNKWYHLAGTYDGEQIRAYMNGALLGSTGTTGEIEVDDSELLIGRGDPEFSGGEYFAGELDEMRVWNVARSQSEIREGLDFSVAKDTTGLLAAWDFDDGTTRDVSGHQTDGKLTGTASIQPEARDKTALDLRASDAPKETPRSPDKWLATLEELWTKLSNIYPALEYKGIEGISWMEPAAKRVRQAQTEEEFHTILLELMARLNDTHTRIVYYPGQPRLESPPVFLNQVEGKVAVIQAEPDTGLSPGEVIVAVEGTPTVECIAKEMKQVCNSTERGRLREACSRLLAGRPGSSVTVTVEDANKTRREVKLRRQGKPTFRNEPAISSRKLEQQIGRAHV